MASYIDVRLKQRAVIEFLTAEGCAPVDVHRRMTAVYGVDACVDVSTVRRWARCVKKTNPVTTSLRDKPRSGRPVTATDEQHQARVDELIRANRRIKLKDIVAETEISLERVHYIIHAVLGYRKLCARWVPRMLTPEGKENRKRFCLQLLHRYAREGDAFIDQIVTGDESWAHHFDPENKRQSMEFRHLGSPPPRKFKVVASAGKVLMTIFWDCQGIVHTEFLKRGNTINSDRYVETLKKLRRRLQRIRPGKNAILQHDNARPHTSQKTQAALQHLRFHDILPHPPYSPDLAPCDFFLFPKLKEHLKGQHFTNDEEVKAEVRRWCRGKRPDFFLDGMHQLVHRWRVCVDKDGDYVEK
jgi:[histone H3]-lysine36 N-dimethyltransferase SETMAR